MVTVPPWLPSFSSRDRGFERADSDSAKTPAGAATQRGRDREHRLPIAQTTVRSLPPSAGADSAGIWSAISRVLDIAGGQGDVPAGSVRRACRDYGAAAAAGALTGQAPTAAAAPSEDAGLRSPTEAPAALGGAASGGDGDGDADDTAADSAIAPVEPAGTPATASPGAPAGNAGQTSTVAAAVAEDAASDAGSSSPQAGPAAETSSPAAGSPAGATPAWPSPAATGPAPTVTPSTANTLMMGINLAGGEFGSVGGAYGSAYTYPSHEEIDYYADHGMRVIRLPFLLERLQTSPFSPLDATELSRIDDVVNYATSKGLKVVVDAHNYGKAFGSLIGPGGTSDAAFADFWGKLAGHFAGNANVIFGLMNEPNQQSAATWLNSANGALAAIRQAGAGNEVLVPGSYWDGAWTWTTSDNASVLGSGIKDPANNFAFEVHQYLDQDGSGTSASVVSDSVGVQRLQAITQWAEATGNKLFLGEFGVASDSQSLTALDGMLAYMKQHQSVWQGATYWAGGPWWGSYMYSAEPDGGQAKPQLGILEKYA